MFLRCELEARTSYSMAWRRLVTPHGLSWWVLKLLERPTGEKEFGSWRTPTATDCVGRTYHTNKNDPQKPFLSLNGQLKLLGRPDLDWSPIFRGRLMGYPEEYLLRLVALYCERSETLWFRRSRTSSTGGS